MKYKDKLDRMTDAELLQEGRRILKQADRMVVIGYIVTTISVVLAVVAVVITFSH